MRQKQSWRFALAALAFAGTLSAQEAQPAEEPASQVEEVIVVTASRTEQALNEAPAAITVLDAKTIESIPADDYGDLLRNVPGVNVTQTSARDINMTTRGSTNTLSTSQLVLLDGRSIYLDFFGFVMWDFLPVNPSEIKQIEAVRGPGSAVWGANAMTGVVNLITKRPKEMAGTSLLLGGGELGTAYGSITHAGVSGNMGYKLSGGYYEQDAYDRPVFAGIPAFENEGTSQPKGDVRLDWDVDDSSYLTVGAGYAGTDGIVHSGIGPFDIDSGSNLSYGKVNYSRGALSVGLFANFLSADSLNLVTRGLDGRPLGFEFTTDTYNFDLANTTVLGGRNILTYGGNYRKSEFELEIAPEGTDKDEWGVFLQDEILLGEKVRWLIGGRYDDIDPLDDGVFTPRTSLLISPVANHTFRLSYNEAFRTPSVINNYLDADILVGPPSGAFVIPAAARGPELLGLDLVEEHLTAYEVGYVGSFANGLSLSIAAYENQTEDSIDFFTAARYGQQPGGTILLPATVILSPETIANLPPGVPPAVVAALFRQCFAIGPTPQPLAPGPLQACPVVGVVPGTNIPVVGFGGLFPAQFSYRNIGETTDRGVEVALQQRRGAWSWFLNASWQDDPEFEGIADTSEQNIAPEWRANAGFGYDTGPWFLNLNVNYQDEAFWGDVALSPATVGFTDSFTLLNVGIGVRMLDERLTLQVIGANVTDEEARQHFFGDIISRKVTGQLGLRF
jgi:outer membrane receptor protein involved in Fe transport